MSKHIIRSSLFNISFLVASAISCVIYIPTLFLPRKIYLNTVRAYLHTIAFLERNIMGISYEIRGQHHLPKSGPFLIAAKHQSLFETFKLHLIFDDPAIILKKELLQIPLWGWFLKKADVIAIDRSTPERALRSIEQGALHVKNQGRPIVIFPQGTRVQPSETPKDKPYKAGIARVQAAADLPVIPMALNSGVFWPKRSWLKKPGVVIFEFMEPVPPGKMERKELMEYIEKRLEEKSNKLAKEVESSPPKRPAGLILALAFLVIFGLYSVLWTIVSAGARNSYVDFVQDIQEKGSSVMPPRVSGYPGPIRLHVAEEHIQSAEGTLKVTGLKAKGWPLPFLPINITAQEIEVTSFKWRENLRFDNLQAKVTSRGDILKIHDSALRREDFKGGVTGTIDFGQQPYPKFDLIVSLTNHERLLEYMGRAKIIKSEAAVLMSFGLSAFKENGIVTVPIVQKDRTLYAGPLPVASLPEPPPQERDNLPGQGQ